MHKNTGDNPKIVIVLPAYNADKTLKQTYEEIPEKYRENVILVDDASSDGTVEMAKSLGINVFVHNTNLGYGANQKTCYTEALKINADIVVMLHPDHQYDASVISKLIQPIIDKEAQATFGSRMLGGKPLEGGMPYWKYSANVFLTAVANIVFKRFFTEIHSGYRAYSKKYLEKVNFDANSDDFIFDTEIIAQGIMNNLNFLEVPITTRYFDDASSIKLGKGIKYGLEIFWTLAKFWLHKTGLAKYKFLEPKLNLAKTLNS